MKNDLCRKVQELIAEKLAVYPHDKRVIAWHEVTFHGGDVRVSASAIAGST